MKLNQIKQLSATVVVFNVEFAGTICRRAKICRCKLAENFYFIAWSRTCCS